MALLRGRTFFGGSSSSGLSLLGGGVSPFRTALGVTRLATAPISDARLFNQPDAAGGSPVRILDASVPTYPTAFADARASSATYYNSSGVLSTAASNVLRTDYNPATLALRGILVEDTATNLLLQSVDISNASWSGAGYTFGSDATLAPDGSTATKCTVTAGTSNKERYQQQPYTTGVTYTDTLYAQAGTNNYVYMSRQYASTISVAAVFDLSGTSDITASQTAVSGGGAPPSIISATGQYVGNGWFRLSLVSTQIAGDTAYYTIIGPVPAATGNVFTSGGEISWTAAGTETFYFFGPQREVGSVGTSYIPTTTTTVTRAADADSFTLNASATQLTFTFDDLSTQIVTGLTGGSTYTIPTNLNRPWILYIDDDSGAAADTGTGAAAGTSTVAAVGASLYAGVGSAAGTSTVSGVGASLAVATGAAAGISTVTATGKALFNGVGSAAGTSTVTATGAALASSVGNAAGTSTVLATGRSTAASTGASAGVSTVSGVGAALAASIGSAAGTSTDAATGSSLAKGVSNAAGTSTVLGVSGTVAAAAGTSTVTGVGAALFNAVGAAAGTSTVTAAGVGAAFAVGVSSGTSTVSGIGKSLAVTVGSAAGVGTAAGFSPSLIMQAVGLATGSSIVVGVGNTHRPGIWQIAVRGTMDIPTPWKIGNTAIDTIPTVPGAQSIYSDSTPDIYQVGDIYSQTAQNTWKVATRGNMDVQTAWKIAR